MISYKVLVSICFVMFILIIILLLCLLRALSDRNYWENNRNGWHDLCHETQLQLEKMVEKINEEKDPVILFECDRNACDICRNPECHHTFNIEHAVNFEHINEFYVEKIRHVTTADVTRDLDILHKEDN